MDRSRFLTYWTGKDIERNVERLDNAARKTYLDRLWNILHSGLWMTDIREEVIGWSDSGPNSTIRLNVPMTCFTELRLSQSRDHFTRYGLLGIVVDREFVLTRHGGPVHYISSHPDESIVGNFVQTLAWVQDQSNRDTTGAKELLENIKFSSCFLKAMSTTGADKFTNLDENEWRIVHTNKCQQTRLIVSTGSIRPRYRIPLSPSDLKLIVVPDVRFRDLIGGEDRIKSWFEGTFPLMLTVEEVEQF